RTSRRAYRPRTQPRSPPARPPLPWHLRPRPGRPRRSGRTSRRSTRSARRGGRPGSRARPHGARCGSPRSCARDDALAGEPIDVVVAAPDLAQHLRAVLAEERTRAPVPHRRPLQTERRAETTERAEHRVLEVDEELPGDEMRVVEDVAVIRDLPTRNAGVSQERQPVHGGLGASDLLDRRDELLAVMAPCVRVTEARVRFERAEPEYNAEGLPVRRRRRADNEVTVGRRDGLVRGDELVRGPGGA